MSSAALQDPFALEGTTLDGQYRVDQMVGEGGYGVVYRGWHVALEQPIAIKALKVMSADSPAVQDALFAKFKDEAKLLYTLSQASLHIVRSMDFGAVTTPTGAWAPYMILEWLEGRSLDDDLEQRRERGMRGRSLDEALALLEPAAEGLSVAHTRRVAHRDIKPANFFLLDAREGPRVKVLDFGIAKIIRDGEGSGTRSPFASFTWLYAAPEQLDPRLGQSGLATDVYSFALLFSEVLTDRVPTDGRDVVSLMKATKDPAVRPTPRTRGADVPDAIELACRRALSVDPAARFATIGELWAALSAGRSDRTAAGAGQRPSMRPSTVPVTLPSAGGVPAASAHESWHGRPVQRDSWEGRAPQRDSWEGRAPQRDSWQAPASYGQPVAFAPGPHGPLAGAPGPYSHPSHVVTTPAGRAPPFAPPQHGPMTGAYASQSLAHHTAAAMSPPPMSPPPGTRSYTQRTLPPPSATSSVPIIVAIVGLVVGLMFVGTCAAVHAACGG